MNTNNKKLKQISLMSTTKPSSPFVHRRTFVPQSKIFDSMNQKSSPPALSTDEISPQLPMGAMTPDDSLNTQSSSTASTMLFPAVISGPEDGSVVQESENNELEIITKRSSSIDRPLLRKAEINPSSNPLEDFSEDRFDTKKESYLAGYIAGMNARETTRRRY